MIAIVQQAGSFVYYAACSVPGFLGEYKFANHCAQQPFKLS